MKILDIEQGSSIWLETRKSKISGTDSAIIMNVSPFKNYHDLWQQKLGIVKPDEQNFAMAHGTLNEPIARDLLIEKLGIHFEPIVALHDTHEWAMASLDGYNEDNNVICEIKCPVKIDGHNLALQGQIREYYLPQIQHCLWVTGAVKCYFMSYFPNHETPVAIIEIEHNPYYIDHMIKKELEFFRKLCQFEEPTEWEFKK